MAQSWLQKYFSFEKKACFVGLYVPQVGQGTILSEANAGVLGLAPEGFFLDPSKKGLSTTLKTRYKIKNTIKKRNNPK
jgi:hypothetical protein